LLVILYYGHPEKSIRVGETAWKSIFRFADFRTKESSLQGRISSARFYRKPPVIVRADHIRPYKMDFRDSEAPSFDSPENSCYDKAFFQKAGAGI
jgi:hypothetical protein